MSHNEEEYQEMIRQSNEDWGKYTKTFWYKMIVFFCLHKWDKKSVIHSDKHGNFEDMGLTRKHCIKCGKVKYF